jgi:hypothetical protein
MSRELLERLRFVVEEGLGPHHNYTGDCVVRLIDRLERPLALRLRPGEVTLEEAPVQPRGTLRLHTKVLEVLLTGIAFDFRQPEVQRHLRFDGDVEFIVRAVVLALRRPTEEMREAFARAETTSPGVTFTRIERVAAPSADRFVQLLGQHVPFIVTGALGAWPAIGAFERWLLERDQVSLGPLLNEEIRLGDFVRRARAHPGVRSYSHGSILPQALEADFPLPEFTHRLQASPPQLWLGTGKDPDVPVTTLHRDAAPGLLGHVVGRKRFTVFPPHQADFLYVRPGYDQYQHCWVEPHQPDLERYPKFRNAMGVDFVLEPGELLIQPTGWFHCVYSLDTVTASVSRFFDWA